MMSRRTIYGNTVSPLFINRSPAAQGNKGLRIPYLLLRLRYCAAIPTAYRPKEASHHTTPNNGPDASLSLKLVFGPPKCLQFARMGRKHLVRA